MQKHEKTLLRLALDYPETHEDRPWGHRAIKVRSKVFVFLGLDGGELFLSVKLPASGREALLLPFTRPTEYGLGKHGWVSARFSSTPPLALIAEWIDESYRTIAPKRLVALLTPEAGRKRRALRKKA